MNYLANFACAAILLASCSREDDMIGTYEADRYHFLEMTPKVIFEKTGFVANCTLELNEDSTFVYRKTCNSIMEGYWRIQSDSLILDIDGGPTACKSTDSMVVGQSLVIAKCLVSKGTISSRFGMRTRTSRAIIVYLRGLRKYKINLRKHDLSLPLSTPWLPQLE